MCGLFVIYCVVLYGLSFCDVRVLCVCVLFCLYVFGCFVCDLSCGVVWFVCLCCFCVVVVFVCVFFDCVNAVCLCMFCVMFYGLLSCCVLLWLSVFFGGFNMFVCFVCDLLCDVVFVVCVLCFWCALCFCVSYLMYCVILSGAVVCVFE